MHSFHPTPSSQRYQAKYGPNPNPELSTTLFEPNKKSPVSFKESYSTSYRAPISKTCRHEQRNNKNWTFSPEVHELPQSIYNSKLNQSSQEIRQNLFEDKTRLLQVRHFMKTEKELQETRECTFYPNISVSRSAQTQLIFQRLYEEAKIIQLKKCEVEKKNIQRQTQQVQKLQKIKLRNRTTVLNSEKHNMVPIHERIIQIVAQKIQLKKKLLQNYNNQLSFQPQVYDKSNQLAKNRIERQQLKKNVVQRLIEEVKKRKEKKQKLQEQKISNQLQQCTFKPDTHQYIPYIESEAKQRRLQHHQQPLFCPKIDSLSDMIVMYTRGDENMQTKVDRLTYAPVQNKKKTIQKLQSSYYADFSFQPTLNPISVSSNPQRRCHHCPQPNYQEFNYRPQINPRSRIMRPYSTQQARQRTNLKKKDLRKQQQYQLFKQCSFQPKINEKVNKNKNALDNIGGIEKFMQNRESAKKKERLLKQREKEVFGWAERYDRRIQSVS